MPLLRTPEKTSKIEPAASANASAEVLKLAASANTDVILSAVSADVAAASAVNQGTSEENPSGFPVPPAKRARANDADNFGKLLRWVRASPNASWFPEPNDFNENDASDTDEPPEFADSDDAAAFYSGM